MLSDLLWGKRHRATGHLLRTPDWRRAILRALFQRTLKRRTAPIGTRTG
jgi:hypothetical protein